MHFIHFICLYSYLRPLTTTPNASSRMGRVCLCLSERVDLNNKINLHTDRMTSCIISIIQIAFSEPSRCFCNCQGNMEYFLMDGFRAQVVLINHGTGKTGSYLNKTVVLIQYTLFCYGNSLVYQYNTWAS